MVKSLLAMQETRVQSLGWEDPIEKEMETHSSITAWEIPWTEEPSSYNPWGGKELYTTERLTVSGVFFFFLFFFFKFYIDNFVIVDKTSMSCSKLFQIKWG